MLGHSMLLGANRRGKRQEHGDILVEYQRCKMHGTYSFWGNQPNSSDLIPRAIIIGKATI